MFPMPVQSWIKSDRVLRLNFVKGNCISIMLEHVDGLASGKTSPVALAARPSSSRKSSSSQSYCRAFVVITWLVYLRKAYVLYWS